MAEAKKPHTLPPTSEKELRRLKPLMKLMTRVHPFLIRATGGRFFNSFLGAPVGLLVCTGRKSGRRLSIPLLYLEDAGRIVLVASQGGMPKHPLWFHNVEADPNVAFEIRGASRNYRARRASADEKQALWPKLCAVYADYEAYQRRTERDIPVLILDPVA